MTETADNTLIHAKQQNIILKYIYKGNLDPDHIVEKYIIDICS